MLIASCNERSYSHYHLPLRALISFQNCHFSCIPDVLLYSELWLLSLACSFVNTMFIIIPRYARFKQTVVYEPTTFDSAIIMPDHLYLLLIHHYGQVIVGAIELVHWRVLLLFTLSGKRPRRQVV